MKFNHRFSNSKTQHIDIACQGSDKCLHFQYFDCSRSAQDFNYSNIYAPTLYNSKPNVLARKNTDSLSSQSIIQHLNIFFL